MKKVKGLTDNEVEENRKKYGANVLQESEPLKFIDAVKDAIDDPILKLLIAITLVFGCMALFGRAEWYDVIGILLAVVIVTFVSANQSIKDDRAYRKLKSETEKPICKVIRNGVTREVLFSDVVVGDLVLLEAGDKVPADGVIIDGNLVVNNASLNGETRECHKSAVKDDFDYEKEFEEADKEVALGNAKTTKKKKIDVTDAYSVYRGQVIFDGQAIAEIKEVGMETLMGSMQDELNQKAPDTPLKIKLSTLADQISKFGYIGAVVIAIAKMIAYIVAACGITAYLGHGAIPIVKDILESIRVAAVIIVMAVPEGLPLMISIVLMCNTKKMYNNNVLVRVSKGIETAGSLNVLCTDKTGTITKGELEVVEFFDGGLNKSYKTNEKINKLTNLCICKNTGAVFDNKKNVIGGNATDKALMNYVTFDTFDKYRDLEVFKTQLFNSANKYSSAQLKDISVYKGAPEKLLVKAKKYLAEDGTEKDIDLVSINNKIDELADRAMRVIAFGYSKSELQENVIPEDLVLVGFVGIRDDVRPDAKEAISKVRGAGVQVIMITGDRKETAVAIAKDSNLITKGDNIDNIDDLLAMSDEELNKVIKDKNIVLTSEELKKYTDAQISRVAQAIKVIARALPTDKSRMVKILQSKNLVVGMTGDGVNDSPALKLADVGFAMGSGTDVAKDASEIVITDNSFNSIVKAVLFGRTIYNNICKFICYQLTINVSAVIISAICPFIGINEPLTVVHILWINLIMDGLAALAFGMEPAFDKYMEEKPKVRNQKIVSKTMATRIGIDSVWLSAVGLAIFLLPYFKNIFTDFEVLRTGYFTFFVLSAVFNGFNVRSEGLNLLERIGENKNFMKIMSIITVVQIAITFIGGKLFHCESMNLYQWTIILILSFMIIPVDLLRKVILKAINK